MFGRHADGYVSAHSGDTMHKAGLFPVIKLNNAGRITDMGSDTREYLGHRSEQYEKDYAKYGYSPCSLSMPSDRRNIRYYELLKNFPLPIDREFVLCDAGCGFGDINAYLPQIGFNRYQYIGLDVVDPFISEGRSKYGSDAIRYYKRDFTNEDISDLSWDFAICSQTFNVLYGAMEENYDMMFTSVERLFSQCSTRGGVSFNFFNTNVDFKKEDTAYYDPARVLDFALSLSKNVVLDNSCMPFESTVTILKNDSFRAGIFDHFYKEHEKEFTNGLFKVIPK